MGPKQGGSCSCVRRSPLRRTRLIWYPTRRSAARTPWLLATSCPCAIAKVEELEGAKFDAIFCGKQAIDGDTAQVGPELAELLDYPQVTYALEAEEAEGGLHILKEGRGRQLPHRRQVALPDHLHQAFL